MTNSNYKLTKEDFNQINKRSLFTFQLGWNYERMQASGYLYMILPQLRKMYGDGTPELKEMMKVHTQFFNTSPFFHTIIAGFDLAMEEKDGVGSKDAVNGSQLYQATSGISNGVNLLNSKIGKVGAGAAALAAIHPLDFDPDDKWNFAAGYGNYAGENAMALGAFYRPNEDTMFSVAGSMGNGENMVNGGVSLKLGQKNGVSTSRVALAKEVQDLKAIVKAQNVEIQQMKASMGMAPQYDKKDVNFPDVPANHWAYEYVKDLADKGLVEGYPDGEFKGDRTMTRYEYAAIIYRALQLGAPIDGKMGRAINEFNPELARLRDLDRIRVDRISGKDNDRHKVERLRVNNKDNKQTNDYRDVYGSHIERNAK